MEKTEVPTVCYAQYTEPHVLLHTFIRTGAAYKVSKHAEGFFGRFGSGGV